MVTSTVEEEVGDDSLKEYIIIMLSMYYYVISVLSSYVFCVQFTVT